MAIIDAFQRANSLTGARLYHIKIKNGKITPSGKPSCTVCSRLIYESGISKVVLLHEKGIGLYTAEEFNKLSFEYFK